MSPDMAPSDEEKMQPGGTEARRKREARRVLFRAWDARACLHGCVRVAQNNPPSRLRASVSPSSLSRGQSVFRAPGALARQRVGAEEREDGVIEPAPVA